MVVLQEDGHMYEIKVVRVSDNTYFGERVKIGEIEEIDASKADRYIVAEPGQAYAVEVTVKKGLRWSNFDESVVNLTFTGGKGFAAAAILFRREGETRTSEDTVLILNCVNDPFQPQRVIGSPFVFRTLSIGMFETCVLK
jgi:hypothetical protein